MRALNAEPIVGHADAATCVATRNGAPIAAGRFVADVIALAARLGAGEHVLNICRDRYAFAVSFCAALVAGRTNLLPPSRTPEALRQLATQYPSLVVVGDGDAASEQVDGLPPPLAALRVKNDAARAWPPPQIARDHIAAIAFTSGSTGTPQPQPKRWGGIVDGAHAEIDALGLAAHLHDAVLVGTVSAQHMYGLESTVLLALHGPCAFAAEHPLHPAEVIDTLARQRGTRVLITTPVHLRALADAALAPPRLACVVSATAPLTVELASKCELTWATQVMEVYGCTETGMVATRRTTDGAIWHAMRDVKIEARGAGFWASGGHVAQSGPLADRLRLHDATRFELLGRADDIVNIGGKRASLAGLNRTLLEVPGVADGVIFLPEAPDPRASRELRLTALVVAPTLKRAAVLAALRARLDPVFLPRPLLLIDALPRNAQGKLPRAALLALVEQARGGATLSLRERVARSAG
jgi:acyl-coenzyme A synthetase/AMP-(fatty) acid ligase